MKREMSSKIVSRFRGRASTPLSRPLPSFSLPLYIGTACCTQQHVSAHHTEPQRTQSAEGAESRTPGGQLFLNLILKERVLIFDVRAHTINAWEH